MDLATAVIILGTIIGGVFFIMDKYLYDKKLQTKKGLLIKFNEVKEKGSQLLQDMEHSVRIHDNNLLTDFVCVDYIFTLKEKIEIEYSDSEYQKLKKIKLTKEKIIEYSERFRYHQDLFISLRQEYNHQIIQLNFKAESAEAI